MTSPLSWRMMAVGDLPKVLDIAAKVHPDFPEDEAVFAERQALFPKGCYVLESAEHTCGYIISHPWMFKKPPELNSLLNVLPDNADTYYLHDLAILPDVRGGGYGVQIVSILKDVAKEHGLDGISLVSVNGSVPYWQSRGFQVEHDPLLDAKLASYEEAACFMVMDLACS